MGTFVSQWRAWLVVPAGVAAVVVAMVAATTGTTAVASTALPPTIGSSSTTTSTTAPSNSSAGPPVKVLLFGDSVALTLGLGLGEQNIQDKYDYQLTDKGIIGCGVVDSPQVELMGTLYDTPLACGGSGVQPGGPAAERTLAGPVAGRHQPGPSQRGRPAGGPLGGGRPRGTTGSGRTFCIRPSPPTSRANWTRLRSW